MLEGINWLVGSRGCIKQCIFCPYYLISWFTCLRLDWLGTQFVFIVLLFQPLEPHHHHKASNHHMIYKLMHYLYYSSPLHVNSLIHGMSNIILIVTAKCFSDLTLLCIDIQHFSLKHHAGIFIAASGALMY